MIYNQIAGLLNEPFLADKETIDQLEAAARLIQHKATLLKIDYNANHRALSIDEVGTIILTNQD